MDDLGIRLSEGISALDIPSTQEQQRKLLAFLRLIDKWNRVYNLTAIRDLRTGVDLHLLDSLTVWPYLRGERIIDVGTGAGLPGIPLAIMSGSRHFVLLDSNAKKTRFVQQAVIELGLPNVEVITTRVEDYRPERAFDTVVTRAYASLADILAKTRRLLIPRGVILAQKGQLPEKEVQSVKHCTVRTHKLTIPGLDVERHLVEIAIG
ncbi:16S rRNA (guanine(527)-N(7))-methyltransferase RsmG [Methylocaldum szegediense]|uniref:Ribosomal RNA small subunit methyltransferase G n=1 Tax=Methylocaldum szegediense TaxID=73780 RepID=A0ABM9I459_9GAMM|nr:16S rRNA (guanine(527)-N(7))-methyltransferase RsmG [Methylocaldum szegediense]CAI8879694.1 16S rRNA m(7)G527 methyltransferase [Methylocaldum szegediense]